MALKANDFLSADISERHVVKTPVGELVVYIKPITWIQQQEAMSKFVDFIMEGEEMRPKIDFGGYWQYILQNCVESTEPKMSKNQLLGLKPEVGQALMGILPSIEYLMSGFTGSEPDPLE